MPKEKIAEFCKRKKIMWLAKLPYPSRESVINYADVAFWPSSSPASSLGWDILYHGCEELGETYWAAWPMYK